MKVTLKCGERSLHPGGNFSIEYRDENGDFNHKVFTIASAVNEYAITANPKPPGEVADRTRGYEGMFLHFSIPFGKLTGINRSGGRPPVKQY